jgi:hypothetical protein
MCPFVPRPSRHHINFEQGQDPGPLTQRPKAWALVANPFADRHSVAPPIYVTAA